ncbi:MAG TPA: phasin family protein [Sphingomicrobium sp.]|nr:phasin family protein [Sphingomicrobium sp.]
MNADAEIAAETTEAAPEAIVETVAPSKLARKAKAKGKTRVRAKERNEKMTKQNDKIFGAFAAFPAGAAFENLFADASQRGEEAVKRSRKAAEELADLYRGNLDAVVEAGKIAAAGAQSIGQDLVAKSRDSLEQTANSVRTFAEAKSPTELLQLQSDFARTAFDRFVEDSSALTESFVKLAGEAFQPLSSRASANVEKFNQIAA